MIERVKKYIRENQMLKAGDIVAAGVSGGADSIAMLHILKSIQEEFGFFLEAVHVHHGIRGDEADRDENLVKKNLPGVEDSFSVLSLSGSGTFQKMEAGRRRNRTDRPKTGFCEGKTAHCLFGIPGRK